MGLGDLLFDLDNLERVRFDIDMASVFLFKLFAISFKPSCMSFLLTVSEKSLSRCVFLCAMYDKKFEERPTHTPLGSLSCKFCPEYTRIYLHPVISFKFLKIFRDIVRLEYPQGSMQYNTSPHLYTPIA